MQTMKPIRQPQNEPHPVHILSLHKVGRRSFDLSGLRPVSIRDQLLRSTALVDALLDRKKIDENSALLVFGAGVAGMNAALRAEAHGVKVDVIERSDRLFSSFFRSKRAISFTEYDWPNPPDALPRWKEVPLVPSLPKDMRSMVGAALVPRWIRICAKQAGDWNDEHLNFRINVFFEYQANEFQITNVLEAEHPEDGPLEVLGPWKGREQPDTARTFGAVLFCLGPGPEKIAEQKDSKTRTILGKWSGFSGPDYWKDSDRMDVQRTKYPRDISSVIISGGGDGGMQDFQRIVTGIYGCELLAHLEKVSKRLRSMPSTRMRSKEILPYDALLRFIAADDAGRRACCWALNGGGENTANWHRMYYRQVKMLVSGWPKHVRDDLARALFRAELFDQTLKVRWIMAGSNIGTGFALNRYLSLLLLALRRSLPRGQIIFQPGSYIDAIKPVNPEVHQCDAEHPRDCMGKLHTVWIKRGTQQYRRNVNLIIIRHGLGEIDRPLGVSPPVVEQIVPFRLPL
jgi:hypothetical protein